MCVSDNFTTETFSMFASWYTFLPNEKGIFQELIIYAYLHNAFQANLDERFLDESLHDR